jgi:hypothetical protein
MSFGNNYPRHVIEYLDGRHKDGRLERRTSEATLWVPEIDKSLSVVSIVL